MQNVFREPDTGPFEQCLPRESLFASPRLGLAVRVGVIDNLMLKDPEVLVRLGFGDCVGRGMGIKRN